MIDLENSSALSKLDTVENINGTMKKGITLVVLLSIFKWVNLFGQYIPMVEENKFWVYEKYVSNDVPNVASGYLILFEGDTIMENLNYKKVFRQELNGTHPCPTDQMPCFSIDIPYEIISKHIIGFVRENLAEKKIYYRSIAGDYCEEQEYLLFDFSLELNEELDDCKKQALGDQVSFGKIDSITYDQVFGTTRRVLHSFGYVTYIGLPYEGPVNLIEGIGFDRHGLFHEPNNLNELYDFCQGTLSDCNIISKAKDLSSKVELIIYPSPTSDLIYVDKSFAIRSAKIISANGLVNKLIHQDNSFNLTGLENGFYILMITTKDGLIYSTKVVKM